MKERLRWKKIVMCRWRPLRMRIKCAGRPVAMAHAGNRRGSGASKRAGPSRGNELTWDVQVYTMAYEPEPDKEIRPGTDAPCVCNLRHGARSIARVHKKGRSARVRMIL